jgi:ubiquinone/menaquinone biosynthesis C-methylase UbiE
MDAALEQIRETQKLNWNKNSVGWRKWDEFNMNFMRPMGDAIISSLMLKDTDNVLDIAAGTGEPGITIASIVKHGKVIGTDLAADMLAIAGENALKKGLTNYTTTICDVCELPFPDNSFDAISCRFGFMFFPDMQMAAKEMARVLKSGGRLATSVWAAPEKNPWVTMPIEAIRKHIPMPAPPPGSPGIFRCAAPGLITDLFIQTGLTDVTEETMKGAIDYGSKEYFWQFATEVASLVVAAMSKADDQMKELIRKDAFAIIDAQCPDALIPFEAIIISGRK